MTTSRSQRQKGFTTIELLVVIAVIAVLIALTTGAISRVRVAAKRSETANEAGQLGAAVGVFLRDKRVDYIPSTIVLRERMDYNMSNNLEIASVTYLKQVWPQITLNIAAPNYIDWNGNGSYDANPVTLEGDQCLVFFLGGIPQAAPNNRYLAGGFGKNPSNPAAGPLGSPTFEFKTARLLRRAGGAGPSGFPSYFDPHFADVTTSKAYAYFSSYGRKNGYVATDCSSLSGSFAPYRDTATTFYQPTGFQIISAGIDENFGVGGLAPSAATALGQPDGDNITQFANGQMSNIGN